MKEPKGYHGIMVSSTFIDLPKHRKALIKLIHQNGLHAIAMELQGGARADLDVLDSSLEKVRDCAAYIGIISHRYGQISPDAGRNPRGLSITELEFDEAVRQGRPILLFLMTDDHPVRKRDVEVDSAQRDKLEAFRERAKLWDKDRGVNRVYEEFGNLAQFRMAAAVAIPRLRELLDRGALEGSSRRKTSSRGQPADGTVAATDHIGSEGLALLCDRAHAARAFDDVLRKQPGKVRPGYVVLFGEDDQGQADFFRRINVDILSAKEHQRRYGRREATYVDLSEFHRFVEDVRTEIVYRVAQDLSSYIDGGSFDDLCRLLQKKGIGLCLIYCVVQVSTRSQARWWVALFDQMRKEFCLNGTRPQIVLSLSIAYPRGSWFLGPSRRLTRFFERQYPAAFLERPEGEEDQPEELTRRVRRLSSGTKEHVKGWYNDPRVGRHVAHIDRTEFLQVFDGDNTRPMEEVLTHLRDVLRNNRI